VLSVLRVRTRTGLFTRIGPRLWVDPVGSDWEELERYTHLWVSCSAPRLLPLAATLSRGPNCDHVSDELLRRQYDREPYSCLFFCWFHSSTARWFALEVGISRPAGRNSSQQILSRP